MRNPFRRQTETTAPSLRERAADLSSRLADAIRRPEATEDPTFPVAPTDLADACLWAIRHRAWIDRTAAVTNWSDERFDGESAKTNAVFTRAINEPSANLREITAKAALALEDFERFTIISPDRKQDDGTRIVHTVLREIVGVGREAGSLSILAPDNDLTSAILGGWREWGSVQDSTDDAVQSEADARRRALIHAAMALPATPENIAPKALACAWMEWVETERPGRPRDAYGPADQLVYDIHAATMAREPQETAARAAPPAFDFGPDTHIAELATEFCEAYAANIKADSEHMAGRMPEAEWLPHYQRAARLMDRLEATEPKTLLGMALKCLGPIGAAGYNAPADESKVQEDAWDRVGAQFVNAVLRGDLAPLPTADWHASPVDLIAAAGLSVETLPVSDLCSMLDAAETLSEVAAAITCQPRHMTKGDFNSAGRLIRDTAFALHRAIETVAKELRRRTPADASDRAERLAALARLTIHNDDETETAAFARELLATVEP